MTKRELLDAAFSWIHDFLPESFWDDADSGLKILAGFSGTLLFLLVSPLFIASAAVGFSRRQLLKLQRSAAERRSADLSSQQTSAESPAGRPAETRQPEPRSSSAADFPAGAAFATISLHEASCLWIKTITVQGRENAREIWAHAGLLLEDKHLLDLVKARAEQPREQIRPGAMRPPASPPVSSIEHAKCFRSVCPDGGREAPLRPCDVSPDTCGLQAYHTGECRSKVCGASFETPSEDLNLDTVTCDAPLGHSGPHLHVKRADDCPRPDCHTGPEMGESRGETCAHYWDCDRLPNHDGRCMEKIQCGKHPEQHGWEYLDTHKMKDGTSFSCSICHGFGGYIKKAPAPQLAGGCYWPGCFDQTVHIHCPGRKDCRIPRPHDHCCTRDHDGDGNCDQHPKRTNGPC
ncbi:hypothetical protein [Methylobacter sp.]|uniref:hypothetical protein n=1 Tax=Methylobacter sp. TaxID=2051955 RepID=UPI0011F8CE37|nr:hypothetical protein [Methylobacter sp.]TAK59534.1 MAG: hypothetical protein EPO18_20445 [Methylobacter sp.]